MQIYNSTPWTLEEITEMCPYLGHMVNKWRGRGVALYEHPFDPLLVISVGTAFDYQTRVIAAESRRTFAAALACMAQGHIYTYE